MSGALMKWSVASLLLLLLSGCASSERISLAAGQSEHSLTGDGLRSLISTRKQVVMLRPAASTIRRGGRPAFIVAVYNRSKRPAELRVDNIRATSSGLTNEATPIHVYSYDELVAEVHRKQTWAAIGAGLAAAGGAMSAANAGYTHTYGTYNGYSSGRYSGDLNGSYSGTTMGTYSATTYDSGRAYAAQQMNNAQTAANFAAIEAHGQQA